MSKVKEVTGTSNKKQVKEVDWHTRMELLKADRKAFQDTDNYEVNEQLNRAFRTLRKFGYDARRNLADCGSCAGALIKNDKKYVFTHYQSDRDILGEKVYGYRRPVDAWINLYWNDEDNYIVDEGEETEKRYTTPDDIREVLKANGLIVKPLGSTFLKDVHSETIAVHASALMPR